MIRPLCIRKQEIVILKEIARLDIIGFKKCFRGVSTCQLDGDVKFMIE